MKNIWIVGASGHVGTALTELLDCMKYKMFFTDSTEVDVTNRQLVHLYITRIRPDVIINFAGITNMEECEKNPELAYAVNAIGARNLAVEAQAIEAKLIQLSTDDVFDGKLERAYNEFDTPNPQTVYGKSKYAGEKFIEAFSNKYVIIRSSWVYGTGRDFVSYALNQAKNNEEIEAHINEYACPTSAEELAKIVAQFIDNDCLGIYHAVCKGSCSRYEFASEIIKNLGKEGTINIKTVEHPNPVNSVLDNMMLRIDGLEEPCQWKDALKSHISKIGGLK